jgi:hypothetical protein
MLGLSSMLHSIVMGPGDGTVLSVYCTVYSIYITTLALRDWNTCPVQDSARVFSALLQERAGGASHSGIPCDW